MTDRSPMSMDEIATILAEDERIAVSYRDSTLTDEQEAALSFYDGEPFGDEEDGRSQIVVPVVQEVCDYMTVSVLRTCVSSAHVVEFECLDPDEAEAAAEATEAVSTAFMRHQDGYKVLHDWLKAGLVEKIGIVKTACIEDEKRQRRQMMVDEDQLAALAEAGIEPLQATQQADGTFLIVVENSKKTKKYVDYPIPSEEFLFSARTRHEDDADYLCHRSRKSLSDLVEMGFDRGTVYELANEAGMVDLDGRETQRWHDETLADSNSGVPAMRKVWLREEYRKIDIDDDGIAEMVKVFRVGNTILDIEEVDEAPFVVFCPFPRPHRMVGNSLADKVMDIQRVRSVLLRQALDGTYLTNSPRMFVPEEGITENTIDDLLTVRPGGIVRGKAGFAPEPLHQAFDPSKSMALMELMVGEQESRTGITRLNQGLDADAMNKTATGMALQQASGQQIEEFVARNFVEALSRLFLKKMRLMMANGDPITVKIGGEMREANPANWPGDMDVSIRVGLGTGRKEQRLQYRMQLLDLQQQAMQMGLADKKHLYTNAAGIIRDASLGNPLDYFIDPESPEAQQAAQNQPPAPPDPAMMKVQADAQATQAQMQADQQKAVAELQLRQQESQAKIDAMREESQMKLQVQRENAAQEADLASQKFAFESQMAERQFQFESAMAKETADRNHEVAMKNADAKISNYRTGGALDK